MPYPFSAPTFIVIDIEILCLCIFKIQLGKYLAADSVVCVAGGELHVVIVRDQLSGETVSPAH